MWNDAISTAPVDREIWLRVDNTDVIFKAHWQSAYPPMPSFWADKYNSAIEGTPIAWAAIEPPPV